MLYEYTHTVVMGILNVTSDSFYEGSRAMDAYAISRNAELMISQGADMIDVGACSTRPGFEEVSEKDELERLSLGIRAVREVSKTIPISVDTFRASVARYAIEHLSADIINDVTGGKGDTMMFDTVAALKVPYVLTHSHGSPDKMHHSYSYGDFMAEVVSDISRHVSTLKLAGVNDIIIDPGFGFSKSTEQNYHLLANLNALEVFGLPVLVGISRKSMITRALDVSADQALNGTTVLNTLAIRNGASIIRVHDVKAAREVVKLIDIVNHSLTQ